MASDSGADTCRDLGCCDIHQIVTDTLTLSGGYSNTCKRHKQTICTNYLQKLRFVYILRVDPVVVDDRTKSRAGKSDLCVWILSLQKICVVSCRKSILAEIIQSQKSRKTNPSHATLQCTLLGIQSVWENPLMSCQMQSFILVRIISLLENRHIICAAFMKICIFIGIHRINLKADHLEIFSRDLTGFSDVLHIGFGFALAGKDQDLLQTSLGDRCHFLLDLFFVQLCAADLVVAVKSTVNTVVLTVVCNVDRCKHADTVPKMFPCFDPCSLCDFFQKRQRCR